MRPNRALFFLSIALITLPALSQQRRVEAEGQETKELKRTARRMRIPVEQLKNARAALQEATDLALHLKMPQGRPMITMTSPGMLGSLWVQIYKSKAPAALEGLLNSARVFAASAPDLPAYNYYSNRAGGLMSAYSQLEPDKALEIARTWPNPPSSAGEKGEQIRENMQRYFKRMALQGMASHDPERALALRSDAGTDAPWDYGIESQAISQLIADGKKEQALKLVDQTIADFRQKGNPANLGSFQFFARQLASVDPDRFIAAVQLLGKQNESVPQPGMPTLSGTLQINGQSIPIPASQAMMLNMLRGFPNRPGLVMRALDAQPELKALVDKNGGIDNFLNPGEGGVSVRYTTGYGGTTFGSGSPAQPALLQQLNGKAAKNPEMVRQKLADAYRDPEKVQELINLASMSMFKDPDLSGIALEIAEPMVMRIEPLQKRSVAFEYLVRTYANLEGEVSIDLLREGFILADRLREQLSQPSSPMTSRVPADQLENFLLGQAARQSLPRALEFVGGMSDDGRKVAALVQIAQSLTQNF